MFGIDTAILGVVAGFAINALRAFRSPAGAAVVRILPHAVRLALKVSRGNDAQQDAEDLLKMAPAHVIDAAHATVKDNDEQRQGTDAKTPATRKRTRRT